MVQHRLAREIARRYPGMPALLRAIEICGSQPLLALAIGVPTQRIASWLHQTRTVPLQYVPFIVAVANDPDVTPMTLRPDFEKGWQLLSRQLRMGPRNRRESDPEPAAMAE